MTDLCVSAKTWTWRPLTHIGSMFLKFFSLILSQKTGNERKMVDRLTLNTGSTLVCQNFI